MLWPKAAFLHGRPGPHWVHAAYAKSINAEFILVDAWARWHDRNDIAPIRYAKWLLNALSFPYKNYEVLLVEGPHVWPAWGARYIGKRPCISLLGNETLYFLWSGYLRGISRQALLKTLTRYSALLIIGKMQAKLLKALLGPEVPPYQVTFNGVPDEKLAHLRPQANLESRVVLLIAHGPGGWRTWYKGLDLWMETIRLSAQKIKGLEGWVVGRWDEEVRQQLLREYAGAPVRFLGAIEKVEEVIPQAGLYLHLGRGDAFPNATQEAMAYGVPAIVSEWTGTAEVVEQVWPEGVVPLSPEKAAEAVIHYFSLSDAEKRALSDKSATLIREKYRLSQAIAAFQQAFEEVLKAVGLR